MFLKPAGFLSHKFTNCVALKGRPVLDVSKITKIYYTDNCKSFLYGYQDINLYVETMDGFDKNIYTYEYEDISHVKNDILTVFQKQNYLVDLQKKIEQDFLNSLDCTKKSKDISKDISSVDNKRNITPPSFNTVPEFGTTVETNDIPPWEHIEEIFPGTRHH